MWDTEHERPFLCIDPGTASKLLVVRRIGSVLLYFLLSAFDLQTTRIKGIIPKGLEVELELLGVKGIVKATPASDLTKADLICDPESVELLAAVAEIDAEALHA